MDQDQKNRKDGRKVGEHATCQGASKEKALASSRTRHRFPFRRPTSDSSSVGEQRQRIERKTLHRSPKVFIWRTKMSGEAKRASGPTGVFFADGALSPHRIHMKNGFKTKIKEKMAQNNIMTNTIDKNHNKMLTGEK